jgi:hypothetical protein
MPLRIVSLPVAVPPIIEVMQWQRVNDGDEGLMWVIDRIARSTAKLATRKDQRILEAEEA